MEENENLVVEQTDETAEQPTEQTAEQPPKTYTEAELNARLDELLSKKIARREAKIRKEYDQKYGSLEEVLKAGTGKENVSEIADTFREYYQQKGIAIPEKPEYSDDDIKLLAKAEADEIIRSGYDEVVDEVNRLTELGVANMTPREKSVFKALAEYRQGAERGRELSQMGVSEDVYNSKEFTDFASKFNSNIPIKDVYDLYRKTQPQKEIRTMGSMSNKDSGDGGVKDFYTRDEALKFTKKDFDKNPALFKAVEASMLKW